MSENLLTIQIASGFNRGKRQSFAVGEVRLGTEAGCEVRFDPTWDKRVRPVHARIHWDGRSARIEDAGGGVRVGGRQVHAEAVASGAVIEIGEGGPQVKVEYAVAAEPALGLTPPPLAGAREAVAVRGTETAAVSAARTRKWLIVAVAVAGCVAVLFALVALGLGGWLMFGGRGGGTEGVVSSRIAALRSAAAPGEAEIERLRGEARQREASGPRTRVEAGPADFENSLGMKFVRVPGTDVLFCIWETRVRDFEAFVAETGYKPMVVALTLEDGEWKEAGGTWKDPHLSQGPDYPVVCVSWADAKAFCAWLTQKERAAGLLAVDGEYRMPSDHEWSCAVGIGSREDAGATPEKKSGKIKSVYPWGTAWPPPDGAGNYGGSEARTGGWPPDWGVIIGYWDAWPRTAAVGSFSTNALGLFDIGGNVFEWCEDRYSAKDDDRPMRGGGWNISAETVLLSSFRLGLPTCFGSDFLGFRCVVHGCRE